MQGVLQLAHIARPGRAQQRLRVLGGQRARRQAVGLGVFGDEMVGERDDVAGALAQRRQLQVDDVEAEEQILAEAAIADSLRRGCGWRSR